ncbi:MAG: UvrD-helicase domain-containing protein [Bacteroidetes bacterium]|nr:UvrD-helicase domain-containing protein [Bacteroidota bacterium]
MSFTVYKSSAGSGKTFTLVKEYLQMVLKAPRTYRSILAITFTNKAANEMKERILQALFQIGNQPEKELNGTVKVMFDQIMENLAKPEQELIENARIVTKLILHHYTDFAISTIDSFVHRIIRSFAFDLRIPMSFEVELDTEDILRRMIDLLINRAGSDNRITELLVRFTQLKAEDEKNWNIEDDIYHVAKLLMVEDSQLQVKELREYTIEEFLKIHSGLSKSIHEFESSLYKMGSEAMQLIGQEGIQPSSFYYGNRGIYAYFDRLISKNFSSLSPNSYVRTTVEEDKWCSGKASEDDKAAIDIIKTRLSDIFLEIDRFLGQYYARYILWQEVRKNLYPLAILHEIEKMLNDYKSENNILLISEFNQKIASVALNEPVPFIYERVGEKYQHFLVDEFQDTSVLQWQNLLPLIDNSLASQHFNMVLGDAKQAIYRWRSGEVEQFINLPQVYKNPDTFFALERQHSLVRNFKEMKLNHNFRSGRRLVEFNNAFFKSMAASLPENYKKIYENAAQIAGGKQEGGYVSIEFYDSENNDLEKDLFYLERTLQIIYNVSEFHYEKRDIAILCRNNRNASDMASFLLQHNIPVVSNESLLLSVSPNVRVILSIARLLLNPENDIAKVEIVHWIYAQGLLDGTLSEAIQHFIRQDSNSDRSGSFFQKLNTSGIHLQVGYLQKLTVYEFCEELIRLLGLNKKTDPYLPFFLDAILEQSKDASFDLSAMLEWWEKKKETLSIVVPEEVDAVHVMTIHKSKGLEFPVVIYPFATESLRMTKEKLWIHPGDQLPELKTALVDASSRLEETDFADELHQESNKSLLDLINLLYVVMTRAADRLYILSTKPPVKSDGKPSVPRLLKQFLEEVSEWQEGKLTYDFGDPKTRNTVRLLEREEETRGFSAFHSVDWRKQISLSLQAPEYWDTDHPGGEQEWGTLMHKILAEIHHPDELKKITSEYVIQGILDPYQAEEINKNLTNFINHPKVKAYFNPNLKSKEEVDILLPDGTVHRPDKLIMDGDKVIVVDYKTGRKSQKHIRQVESYLKTLREMGYDQTEGVLLYIHEPEPVVTV